MALKKKVDEIDERVGSIINLIEKVVNRGDFYHQKALTTIFDLKALCDLKYITPKECAGVSILVSVAINLLFGLFWHYH